MAFLEVDDCDAGYGAAEILHAVSMHVEAGEIVTIIGPNGAGKSTLLKLLMGYLTPSRGQVRLDGEQITALRTDQRVRRGVAYVPQLDNVFPNLTVAENLLMGAYALSRSDYHERAAARFEQFPRLAERKRQKAKTLSGGERQMLAMARALMTEPNLLLLDEPSAALAPALVKQVFDTIAEINRQGRTVVIVEQEAEIALQASDRCYVLADGQNVIDDSADRILENETVRESYLGLAED